MPAAPPAGASTRSPRSVVFASLTIAAVRAFRGHFSPEHHHGLELPAIYWHFVDVMWIIVWVTVYLL